jgi:hypothetical protein
MSHQIGRAHAEKFNTSEPDAIAPNGTSRSSIQTESSWIRPCQMPTPQKVETPLVSEPMLEPRRLLKPFPFLRVPLGIPAAPGRRQRRASGP